MQPGAGNERFTSDVLSVKDMNPASLAMIKVHTRVHTDTHTGIQTQTRTHARAHAHPHTLTRTRTRTRTCTRTRTRTSTQARASEIAAILISPLQGLNPGKPPPSDLVLMDAAMRKTNDRDFINIFRCV